MICLMPLLGHTQSTKKYTKHKHSKTHKTAAVKKAPLPDWAAAHNYDATAHVYFPDYYTFYDPNRGGYLYWSQGKYVFTPAMPPVMEKVDMSKTRVQILKGVSLDLQPELNYPYYMEQYPAAPNGNTLVPVPRQGNPAGD